MNYKKTVLSNGIRLITTPFPNTESATVTIWSNVGSRYEDPKVAGISHFLEHMVFKGTSKRPSPKIIANEIDSFGGEFNAATSKEWTCFYIKARSGKLETAFDVLSDMVLDPLIPEEDLEREKGVIVEEIGMYEDTPMMHIDDLFERLVFTGSKMGTDVIGTRETVRGVSKSDFDAYREKYYGVNNLVVTVAGGIDEKAVIDMAEKYLGVMKNDGDEEYESFSSEQKEPQILLESKSIEQAHFILGFRGYARGHEDRFIEAVLGAILGQGMSSRLFTEVREKRGLAYSVRSASTRYSDTGYFETYAGVDPKRIDDAIKVILDQHMGLASGEYKIEAKELSKAKEYIKGHIALSLEDTKSVNKFLGIRELKLGKMETPEDVYAGIDAVTVEDILRVANNLFTEDRLNLALIGNYDDEERFKKLIS